MTDPGVMHLLVQRVTPLWMSEGWQISPVLLQVPSVLQSCDSHPVEGCPPVEADDPPVG